VTVELHAVCPHCLSEHELVTGADTDDSPGSGDLTVCIRCGNVSIYTPTMAMRALAPSEQHLLRHPSVASAVRAWEQTMLANACPQCHVMVWLEGGFTRCCAECNRHVVPHRGCLLR
jgi:5-methylcytosine-specific restriction endonuclease McrA